MLRQLKICVQLKIIPAKFEGLQASYVDMIKSFTLWVSDS